LQGLCKASASTPQALRHGLGDQIKLSATAPEQCFIDDLEGKEKLINKNMEKQKGLYEVFAEDKINLDLYKEKADFLRNEEKRLRTDIKAKSMKR